MTGTPRRPRRPNQCTTLKASYSQALTSFREGRTQHIGRRRILRQERFPHAENSHSRKRCAKRQNKRQRNIQKRAQIVSESKQLIGINANGAQRSKRAKESPIEHFHQCRRQQMRALTSTKDDNDKK